jgi:hypothetical protein
MITPARRRATAHGSRYKPIAPATRTIGEMRFPSVPRPGAVSALTAGLSQRGHDLDGLDGGEGLAQ